MPLPGQPPRVLKDRAGFTLVELLIVISLGVLITSLVAPHAISLYGNLSYRLQKKQWQGLEERTAYESFIRQSPCVLSIVSNTDSKSTVTITCRKDIILQETMAQDHPDMDMKKFYNTKGFLMLTKGEDAESENMRLQKVDSKQ